MYLCVLSAGLIKLCRDGAWVENKGALLTFHYRETPMESRPKMVDQVKRLIESAGFKACTAHCAIEAKPPVEWNKGRASIYILRTAFGLDWSERIRIIYAGDDVTDEDAMKVQNRSILPFLFERRYLLINEKNIHINVIGHHENLNLFPSRH